MIIMPHNRPGHNSSSQARQTSGTPQVSRLIPYPADVPPQYRVLMPEHQQLSILGQVTAEHQGSRAEHTAREQVDDLEQHPAS